MRAHSRLLRGSIGVWLVGAAGILVTLLAVRLVDAYEDAQSARLVDQSAAALERNISRRVGLYQYGLLGARGAIVSLGEGGLNRQAFANYFGSRNHAAEFPGAHGFGVILRVAEADEAAFVAKLRADGHPDFAVHPFAPHPGDRYVVSYVEPEKDNLGILGRDFASEPIRREAAVDSMRTGKARLTAPFQTADYSIKQQKAMVLMLPVYRGNQHLDMQTLREDSAIGWVFARLLTEELFTDVAADQPGLGFAIVDSDMDKAEGALFTFTPREGLALDVEPLTHEFAIFGRHWSLSVRPTPAFVAQTKFISPHVVMGVGAVLTLFTIMGAMLWARGRRHEQEAAEERTWLAAIVDSANDGVLGQRLDGVVTSWNRAAQSIFGYSAEEVIGRPLLGLTQTAEQRPEEERLLERGRNGLATPPFETVRRHKEGHLIHVSVTVSPVCDASGRVVGVSKTVRDISARKASEAKIHELNQTLERQVAERTREIIRMSAWQSAVLNNAGYAIIAVDENWQITVFNPAAEELLGYRAEEVKGCTPALFHDAYELTERATELGARIGREILPGMTLFTLEQERERAREWTYVRKNGARVPVLLRATDLKDQYGVIFGSITIAIDLTERKRAEEELRQANEERESAQETLRDSEIRFRSAFETAAQGMALVALDGHFMRVNAALCGMLGYSEQELLATDFQTITHPDDLAKDERMVAALLENRADSYQLEKRYLHKNGHIIWILLSVSLVRTHGGEPMQFVVQILDITEKHEAEAVLIEARHQAEAADRAKSEFLANMSHEIRTPMNAILGLSHIVGRTDLSLEQQDYVGKIETAGRSLLGILNDILDYSKIEANRLDLEMIDFALGSVIDDLAVIMSVNGRDKGIELTVTLDNAIPRQLRGDPSRLQQVLINLTGNAIKFTENGTVSLSAELLNQEGDQVLVRFYVKDSGIGMTPETRSLLFQPFSQADATTTRRFGGTGLGLAISKRLVELMGGAIGVDSEVGEGSTFWFTIPFSRGGNLEEEPPAPGLKVMIVDDNEAARESLLAGVRNLGWEGTALSTGKEALAAMKGGADPDLLLIDWRMPGMDGLETARRMKGPPLSARAPVVVMVTGFGREELQNAPHAAMADAILIKPVTETALMRAYASLTGETGHGAAISSDGPRLAGLRVLVVEDNPLNQEVARKILQSEGARVEVLDDGRQAVDYLSSFRDQVDIVLMDAQMPVMDGFEASTYVRETLKIDDLPILAVTAGVRASDKEKCLAAGMTDFVAKPLDVEMLIATMLLYVSPDLDAIPAPPPQIRVSRGGPVVADIAATLGLDPQRLKAIAQDGDDSLIPMLRRLAESGLALTDEMSRALAGKDLPALARKAHMLKGSSGNFGAVEIAKMAGQIEDQAGKGKAPKALVAKIAAAAATFDEAMKAHYPAPEQTETAPLDRSRLDELVDLLREKNFAALDLFDELAPGLRGAFAEETFRDLETAIDGLAFERAAELVALAKD